MPYTVKQYVGGFARAFALTDETGERTILVDSGPRVESRGLKKKLRKIGVRPDSVCLILLTHTHSDHTAGLLGLLKLTGAPLMCSVPAAVALSEGRDEHLIPRTTTGRLLARIASRRSAAHPPIVTDYPLDSETDLSSYGFDAVALPTPGHTSGSLSLLTADGQVFIGDLLMKFGSRPPNLAMLSNDVDMLRKSIQTLLDRGAHTFHLSHGGMITRSLVEEALARS